MQDIQLQEMLPIIRSLSEIGLSDYPLEGKVESILRKPRPAAWRSSGFTRSDYLDLMETIVRMGAAWVDERGALIDPVIQREWAQATPRFASSAAILLRFGRIPEHRDTVFRAMTYCCERLSAPETRNEAPDFWMRELVTAYVCLQSIAPAELTERWRQALAKVDPERNYQATDPTRTRLHELHNWAVYSSAGESMRDVSGIGASGEFLWGNGFFDTYMAEQLHRITALGMYRDPMDPITYDVTTRLQFASAIAFGYDGPLRGKLEEILRRGNLTMLLFVSPEGFVPFGGRSSQFNFQEAIISALSELEANRYRQSNPALAGAFKRQARLSAMSVRPWLLHATPVRHMKNQFPPETLHGCDTYGQYSVYSMLAASFFGLAALYADDSIAEHPTPAEIGGSVLALQPVFHKVFATCGGNYLEIDTAADPNHDATGIGRVLLRGLPPALPLGLPFSVHPHYRLGPGHSFPQTATALGPEWEYRGARQRLAEWTDPIGVNVDVIEETTDRVAFTVTYRKDGQTVRETCSLTAAGLDIDWSVDTQDGPVTPLRAIVPVLQSDGATRTAVTLEQSELRIALGDAVVAVGWDSSYRTTLLPEEFGNRHGLYQSLVLETAASSLRLTLCSAQGLD